MKRWLGRWLLKLLGWKIAGIVPQESKYVLIEAPHTCMMDFVIAKFHNWATGMQLHFLIKQEMFFFPLGCILKAAGGLPLNRKHAAGLIARIVYEFENRTHFALAVTPEGTRRKTTRWKSGFYYIACKAQVPIAVGFIDYARKELGVKAMFQPTNNMEQDMIDLKRHYIGVTARYPEKFTTGLSEEIATKT